MEAAPNQVITSQVPRISVSIPSSEHPIVQQQQNTTSQMAVGPRISVPQQVVQQQQQHVKPPPQSTSSLPPQQQMAPPQHQQPQLLGHSTAKKAHLIEAQLNQDQAGAVNPDIHTPFRDKKDACIRLIRYHCMDQPVLSQKDLGKADEIFELTAEHFIAKYAKMVDKYKYLLMKESMRTVHTSELMMLDRMYLSEERQSLMRLRQEAEEAAAVSLQTTTAPAPAVPSQHAVGATPPPPAHPQHPEDYDEWACIQRELGYHHNQQQQQQHHNDASHHHQHHQQRQLGAATHVAQPKRTASSDSRLETLKRFRVDKHNKRSSESVHSNSVLTMNNNSSVQSVSSGSNAHLDDESFEHQQGGQGQNDSYDNELENNSIDEQVQSAIDSILNLQQNTALADLDSILS